MRKSGKTHFLRAFVTIAVWLTHSGENLDIHLDLASCGHILAGHYDYRHSSLIAGPKNKPVILFLWSEIKESSNNLASCGFITYRNLRGLLLFSFLMPHLRFRKIPGEKGVFREIEFYFINSRIREYGCMGLNREGVWSYTAFKNLYLPQLVQYFRIDALMIVFHMIEVFVEGDLSHLSRSKLL